MFPLYNIVVSIDLPWISYRVYKSKCRFMDMSYNSKISVFVIFMVFQMPMFSIAPYPTSAMFSSSLLQPLQQSFVYSIVVLYR